MNSTGLIDAMLSRGVGLNPWFFEKAGSSKFPPHDIIKLDDEHFRLTLAVAGFTRNDLKILLKGEHLTVIGHKEHSGPELELNGDAYVAKAEKAASQVLYRGIAYRDFQSEFMIGENVQISSAKLENGLLEIDLFRQVPEIQKFKEIPILT